MKKTIIYLRTSREEQNPENQKKDCIALAEKLNLKDYEVFKEQKSAFRDNVRREVFEEIKKAIQKGQVKNLIIWDLDRLFRNRIKCVNFIKNYSKIGLKVYSYRQSWFQDIQEKMPEPFNEIVYDLMLQIISWLAEEESIKKSKRIKNAVRKNKEGKTMSYKGHKWGRKSIITKRLIEEIKKLHNQGLNHREIANQVYFYDRSNNKKNPSPSLVYKLLTQK